VASVFGVNGLLLGAEYLVDHHFWGMTSSQLFEERNPSCPNKFSTESQLS
jgi:hypothetical protein